MSEAVVGQPVRRRAVRLPGQQCSSERGTGTDIGQTTGSLPIR